jgi:hypothetical protein
MYEHLIGKRIRLIAMPKDPDPIPLGSEGVITGVTDIGQSTQIDVKWDSGRTLMLCVPPDIFWVLEPAKQEAPA